MIEITRFGSRAALMEAAATRIAERLEAGISERGQGFAALSGGSTPAPAYEALAAMPLDWRRATFLLVDERFVPPTDGASNEALLRRTLAPALAAGATLTPMYAPDLSLSETAARADALYASALIDIALMGVGGDGHTASWFPQSLDLQSALDLTNGRSVIAVDAPGAAGSAQRLTLTRAAVARAKDITLLISGEEKRRLLEDAARARLPVDALFDLPVRAAVLWTP